MPDNAHRAIGSTSRRRVIVVTALPAVGIVVVALMILGNYAIRKRLPTLRDAGGNRTLVLFLLSEGLMLYSLIAILARRRLWIDDDALTCGGASVVWLRIPLSSIREIQVRRTGNFWRSGTDQAIGLVLDPPHYRTWFGLRTHTWGPLARRLGCDVTLPYLYRESLDDIAASIADACRTRLLGAPSIPVVERCGPGYRSDRDRATSDAARGLGATDAGHVHCVRCDYDLFSIRRDSVCPECGAPVARSLLGRPLQLLDRDWRRMVRRGARVLAFAGVCAGVGLISLAYAMASVAVGGAPTVWIALLGFAAIGSIIGLYPGCLWLTRRDPDRHPTAFDPISRRATRYLLLPAPILVLAAVSGLFPARLAARLVVGVLLVCAASSLWYCRRLMLHSPRPFWRYFSTFAAVLFAFTSVIIVGVWALRSSSATGLTAAGAGTTAGATSAPATTRPSPGEIRIMATAAAGVAMIWPALFTLPFAALSRILSAVERFQARPVSSAAIARPVSGHVRDARADPGAP